MKNKRKLFTALFAIMLIVASMTGCGQQDVPETSDNTATEPDFYEYSILDADVFINMPALRQSGYYTCGTTCVQMIMNYLYPYDYDYNPVGYEEDLEATEEFGTEPQKIMEYFDENEVTYEVQNEISTDDLAALLDEGKPVMICIQAWSSAEDGSYNLDDPTRDDYINEGHWVICVGYQNTEDGKLFYFNDPSCVGHAVMEESDLDARWIDFDREGTIYVHYGYAIDGSETVYSPTGAYYLG